MSENVREVIERHHAFYEVLPYYVVLEDRPPGAAATTHRIQAGFDVDVYGVEAVQEPGLSPDYELVCETIGNLVETVLPHTSDFCSIEVIPFGSTVFPDAARHFQQDAMLRIRITHERGLGRPAGAPEERALKEVLDQLRNLGVSAGRGRA
jgi:hypothetical protein